MDSSQKSVEGIQTDASVALLSSSGAAKKSSRAPALLLAALSCALLASTIVLAIRLDDVVRERNSLSRALEFALAHQCPPVVIPAESFITPTDAMAVNGTIAPGSAAYYNRSGDISASPYYTVDNFYNAPRSKTLKILEKFQTYQQTADYSCGPASAFMALRWLGMDSPNVTENTLVAASGSRPLVGTFTLDLAKGIETVANGEAAEWERRRAHRTDVASGGVIGLSAAESQTKKIVVATPSKDAFMDWNAFVALLESNIAEGKVMLVASDEWGGHWMALIGYDAMGTAQVCDDVLVFADPFDTTDHNQDGYIVRSAERFFSMWRINMPSTFPEGYTEQQYVIVSKS